MEIDCRDCWADALDYFRSPTVVRKMAQRGLAVDRFDWAQRVVVIRQIGDDDQFFKQLVAMSEQGTK